jgi:hypothetical protein
VPENPRRSRQEVPEEGRMTPALPSITRIKQNQAGTSRNKQEQAESPSIAHATGFDLHG